MKQKAKWITVVFSSAFLLLFTLSFLDPFLLWDENAYLANARSHISDANFTEDYRYPLLELFIAGMWNFTGESIIAARLIIVLFYLASLFLFYKLAKKQVKHSTLLTALLAFSPLMIFWGFRAYGDVPVVFFILLSLYLVTKENNPSLFAAGIIGALAFLMRFTSAIFVGTIVFYLLFHKDVKRTLLFSAGAIVGVAPWLVFNYVTYNNPLWDFLAYQRLVDTYNTFKLPVFFLSSILLYAHVFVIAGVARARSLLKNKMNQIMLSYVILYIFYFAFVSDVKEPRYLLGVLPFLFLLGMQSVEQSKKRTQELMVVIAIVIAALSLGFTLSKLNAEFYCGSNNSVLQASAHLQQEKDIDIISNVWVWFGYYNNFRVHSIYTTDIRELLETHHPKYFIYVEGLGDPFDRQLLEKSLVLEQTFNGLCGDRAYLYRSTA